MAILRTFKSIENDLYILQFVNDTDALGEEDKKRMRKFGEPEINLGGTFIGGATGFAVLSTGTVGSVVITTGGNGYQTAPAVTFTAPTSGTTAQGTAVITNGVVTSVTITTAGSGYGSTAPTVTFATPTDNFSLPNEFVKVRSGFPVRREFDSTAAPFDTNTNIKVSAYKAEIQRRFTAAFTTLRTLSDTFTGEETNTI